MNDEPDPTPDPDSEGERIDDRDATEAGDYHTGIYDDLIRSGAGDDVVSANAGDDIIRTRGGDDTVWAGYGDDIIDAGKGNDTVRGGFGDDILRGRPGDDWLEGNGGDDKLNGGRGADLLDGGTGADTLFLSEGDTGIGGEGADTFHVELNYAFTTIDIYDPSEIIVIEDFEPGTDTLEITGDRIGINGGCDFGYVTVDGDLHITTTRYQTDSDNDALMNRDGYDVEVTSVILRGITAEEWDTARGFDGTGTEENDTLRTTSAHPDLQGDAGDDLLIGDDEDNRLTGGTGNDSFEPGNGADVIFGNSGDDFIELTYGDHSGS